MLSRFISRFNRLVKSLNVNDLSCKNHYVVAVCMSNRTEKSDVNKYNSLRDKIGLQRIFDSQRNFSLTQVVFASTVASTEESEMQLDTTNALSKSPVEEKIVQALSANGEPTFDSLGLGGYSPPGLLQNALEFLHVSCDMPWFATIIMSTVIIRILMIPLVVAGQRNAIIMNDVMPEMQAIQSKIVKASQQNNAVEYAKQNDELNKFMKEKDFNPIKSMFVTFAQVPVFLSFYFGINGMVKAPVESIQTGGVLWFSDLTATDPYYLLPLMSCGTLALSIYLSINSNSVQAKNQFIGYVMKALPIVIFPFMINFPAALVIYWTTSNFCSLIQGIVFRIPKVKRFLNIPEIKPIQATKKAPSVFQLLKNIQQGKVTGNRIDYKSKIEKRIQ